MILIDMGVSHHMNELSPLQPAYLSQHAGQHRIGCDVERHPQSYVTGSLVHLTRKPVLRVHIELGHQMTRRQGHLLQICHIPRIEQDSPTGWVLFQQSDHL